jgi:hypothetical protein
MNIQDVVLPERKETLVEHPKRNFVLTGFNQEQEFRVFAFEGVAADWSRMAFTVRTNLALARRYGIRLQELPLLCRAILEHRDETVDGAEEKRAFTYSEEDMRVFAASAAARVEAAKQKKPPRPPVTPSEGAAWRVPPR